MTSPRPDADMEPVLAVLIDLWTRLGALREYAVVVGGLVPYLLSRGAEEPHLGTRDVDIAIDARAMAPEAHAQLWALLQEGKYRHDRSFPWRFSKTVRTDEGNSVSVAVDFLQPRYGRTDASGEPERADAVPAIRTPACELALQDRVELPVTVGDPAAANEICVAVSSPVGFLVMKGIALGDPNRRNAERDAYDIYYYVKYCAPDSSWLAEQLRGAVSNPVAKEALLTIRNWFGSVGGRGPVAVADLLGERSEEARAIIARDAFETVERVLGTLGIEARLPQADE